mgnify:FL=1
MGDYRKLMLGIPLILTASEPVYAQTPEFEDSAPVEEERGDVAKEVGRVIAESDVELAQTGLNSAYEKIEKELAPKLKAAAEKSDASYETRNGYAMVKNLLSKGFRAEDYIPLMIKESGLDPNAKLGNGEGYFQIEPIVRVEVRKYYGYEAKDINDPVQNSVLGILMLHRARNHYAENSAFKDLSTEDKDILAYAIYNKGFQT